MVMIHIVIAYFEILPRDKSFSFLPSLSFFLDLSLL